MDFFLGVQLHFTINHNFPFIKKQHMATVLV